MRAKRDRTFPRTMTDTNGNDAASSSSVSTTELARRIRDPPRAAASSKRAMTTSKSPKSQGALGMTIAVSSSMSDNSNSPHKHKDSSVPPKQCDTSSHREGTAMLSTTPSEFTLAKINSPGKLPKKTTITHYQEPEDSDDENDGDYFKTNTNDCPDDDGESSVSTTELARRIRGEPPKTKTHPRVSTNPPKQSVQKNLPQVHKMDAFTDENFENLAEPRVESFQSKIVSGDGDLCLPSPLPSSDDESSSDEQSYPPHAVSNTNWNKSTQEMSHSGEPIQINSTMDEDVSELHAIESHSGATQPVIREGLRSSPGPWAKQRRLNATGGLFANRPPWNRAARRPCLPSQDIEEDIEAFSDEEQAAAPRVSVGSAAATAPTQRSSVRHISDPSMAANVVGGFFRASQAPWNATGAVQRNDLSGGSGVGQNISGQYQMFNQPPPPTASRSAGRGRGRKRSSTRQSGGGGGRGRGRRRGSSRGRGRGRGGRGRGRGSSGGRGRGATYQPQGNAWSDYQPQSTAWASNGQPSDLGNVGGAEISF